MDISPRLRKILMMSFNDARQSRHEFVTAEHVLKSALLFDTVRDLLVDGGADVGAIGEVVEQYLSEKVPRIPQSEVAHRGDDVPAQDGAMSTPAETQGFQNVINRAVCHCAECNKDVLDINDVLVSMLEERNSYCAYSLKMGGLSRLRLLEAIGAEQRAALEAAEEAAAAEEARAEADGERSANGTGRKAGALQRFCTELVAAAKEGHLDKVIGREEETERMVQVLCRRTKNNPILVGEAGVGKTAVAEGLALRIAAGNVPDMLKDCAIYSLDVGLLVAGTKYRGEFEDRVRRITEELTKQEGQAILFIDEIHTIMGAGSASGGALDAASMLKPALSQGRLHCIGSTTYDEYSRWFEKDSALTRRFQKIDIKEPTAAEALLILKGLKDRYEAFHGVTYSAGSLQEAVNLSVRYLPSCRLPDKAIDIIDEAGSYVKTRAKRGGASGSTTVAKGQPSVIARTKSEATSVVRPQVTASVVRTVTSRMAQVSVEGAVNTERDRLRTLEETLKQSVFGQDDAVSVVVQAVKRARAGFRDGEKPEASFLFVGPTGVGKTELSRTLARVLCEPLLRYDMSEYQEEYTVSRLIGAAPGYVGYDEGGRLTEDVRRNPHAVVLFDEMEKAHDKIQNVLLQVMDYGFLTDSRGRKADFRDCIIIMTSNAGARDMDKGTIGFGEESDEEDDATLQEAVNKTFSPEFRGRLNAVVMFHHLSEDTAKSVAKKEIGLVSSRLAAKRVVLTASDEALSLLAHKGWSREAGARNMAHTVEDLVAGPLTDEVLFGRLATGGAVKVDADGGKIIFNYGQQ